MDKNIPVYCDSFEMCDNIFYYEDIEIDYFNPKDVICYVSKKSRQHAVESRNIRLIPKFYEYQNYYKDSAGKNWRYAVPCSLSFLEDHVF